jgi:golgi SNAP receptor complex member 2
LNSQSFRTGKKKQNERVGVEKKKEETSSSAIPTKPTVAAMEFSGGGASLSEMYQSARRLLLSARDGVARVERLASAPTSSSYSSSAPLVGGGAAGVPAVAEEVRREVVQIQTLCSQMDRLWRSIPAKGQRDLWKR